MNEGRIVHTATLLPDGRVLVVGGFGAGGFGPAASTPAELFNPATGQWTPTAPLPLNEGRAHHSATLLPNGQVLVVGGEVGFSGNATLRSSAFIFDPATGNWTPTGNLNAARSRHTATLLPNGKVLVTGGSGDPTGAAIASVEIFDPATGTWKLTNSMSDARILHTATLLPNGRLLVTGGLIGIGATDPMIAGTEIFDPATETWTPIGDLKDARANHTATLLAGGQVLVAGGRPAPTSTIPDPEIGSAELLDPAIGNWTATGDLTSRREDHTATLLADGRVLVAGGAGRSAELYDPATGNWTATGDLTSRREDHTATLLADGRVLVAGGGKGSDDNDHRGGAGRSAELYDPATGNWTAAGDLTSRREDHTATLLADGRVLVAGGGKGSDDNDHRGGAGRSAELYDPATGNWMATGDLNSRREDHTATLLADGRVLVAGGGKGGAGRSAELFDPATGNWTVTGDLTSRREDHTATLLPNGRVLVAGGKGADDKDDTAGRSAELYDPATGNWTATGNLHTRREDHTATLLPDGRVLVVGGKGAAAGRSAELFDPATGNWTAAGDLNSRREGHTATLLPNGQVLVAGGKGAAAGRSAEIFDPATGTWTATDDLNTARANHTATLLLDGRVLVAAGKGAHNKHDTAGRSAELFDRGLGFIEAWRPVLTSATSPLPLGTPLAATGSQFRGISEASGSNSAQNSPTDYPLVQLRRLNSEQTHFLLADPGSTWSDSSFTSVPVTDFPTGHALVTVFTNGIPSISKIIRITGPDT
jgi:N-acetylneuraminic acid mutarotase